MTHENKAPAPGANGGERLVDHAHPGQAAQRSFSTPPAPLEPDARTYCAWRSEPDASTERPTKKPFRRINLLASSTDPNTWIRKSDAEKIAGDPSFISGASNGMCGIGVFLGADIVPNAVLCGVDLDTCLHPETGAPTAWAQAVLDALQSYAETSPSGTGVKVFFLLTPADAAHVQAAMGGKLGKQWKLPGSDHPPGIELYTGGRYFALTGELWPGAPDEIRMVGADNVLRVVREIGPSLKPDASNTKPKPKPKPKPRATANGATNGEHIEHEGGGAMAKLEAFATLDAKARRLLSGDLADMGADKSASAIAWRLGGFCKDAGLSKADFQAALRSYPHADLLKYADDDRQLARIWEKVREDETLGGDNGDEREPLLINGADLTETAAAVTALLTKSPKLYHRDGPVTVLRDPLNGTWATHPLTAHGVTRETHRHTRPFKRLADGSAKRDTLPERVALMALDDKHAWRGLRPIDGFATSPLLGDDGSIRTAEGYDAPSRMFCAAVPDVSVPGIPTRADAEAALLLLRTFLRTFAFADAPKVRETFIGEDGKEHTIEVVDLTKPPGHDESAALHALLTALCRPCLWLAPALVVTAPNISGAGAGKGLLVRVICAIAFGLKPIAITAGHNAEEMDKRIATALIAAQQVLFLDNLNNRPLKSDTLASAITERPSEIRIMRTSKSAKVAVASFIATTGNGLTVSEDMARRVLHVALDAGVEDPESREFPRWRPEAHSTSLLSEAFLNRAELLGAALAIWRWGRQSPDIKPGRAIGSFEDWARWVRDPLVTLKCADPAERIAATKASDPRRAAAAELFEKWNEHHGDKPVAVVDLHAEVREIADPAGRGRQYLASRVRSFAGTRAGGFVLIHSPAIGKWNADKFILKPTQGPGPIGPIGPIGRDGSPMGPMHPMGPDPVAPDNSGDVYEGEL